MYVSWIDLFIYSLFPLSDLYIRATKLNGSIDHMWTLFPLFQLPIFNLLPLLMIKTKLIKRGKMKPDLKDGKPYDIFILMFVLMKYFVTIAVKNETSHSLEIDILGTYISLLLPFLVRHYSPGNNTCLKSKWLTPLTRLMGQSGMIYLAIFSFIYFIPKLRTIYNQFGENITMFMFYFFAYIITNMLNENNIKDFCFKDKDSKKILFFGMISIVMVFLLKKKLIESSSQ